MFAQRPIVVEDGPSCAEGWARGARMVWDSSNLQTRQFVRRAATVSARVEVQNDQADQLRFSFADTQSRMTVIDISKGGLGLSASLMIPKNARLIVRLRCGDGDQGRDLAIPVVVRRCIMSDLKPTYHIGLQYLDLDDSDREALLQLAQDREKDPVAPPRTGSRDAR